MPVIYSVIIPAYNEENSVGRAVRETAAVFDGLGESYEIVLVEDGSTDATRAVAKNLRQYFPALRIITHEINRGKGAAVRTGVMGAAGEVLLFFDCDLAVHPSEAPAFIKAIAESEIVIGSRRHGEAVIAKAQPWYRIAYGRFINWLVRKLTKLPHMDTQCGFKAFRAAAAKKVFSENIESRWLFDVEVLLRARENGCRIAELPVTWSNGEVSRVKTLHVLYDLCGLVFKRRVN